MRNLITVKSFIARNKNPVKRIANVLPVPPDAINAPPGVIHLSVDTPGLISWVWDSGVVHYLLTGVAMKEKNVDEIRRCIGNFRPPGVPDKRDPFVLRYYGVGSRKA